MAIEKEPLCRIDEVAEHFGVSLSTVRKWVKENKLPPGSILKIGRTYRFKLHSIERAFFEQSGVSLEQGEVPVEPSYEGEIVEQLSLDFNEDGEQQ
jgi:excisionase family DNA binding protein